MSACRDVQVEIQTYVDGELDCDRSLVVAVHLERCPMCEHEAIAFAALKRRLRRARGIDVDAVVRLRAFAALLTRCCPDDN
jgi:anti-sigma factor RsiW